MTSRVSPCSSPSSPSCRRKANRRGSLERRSLVFESLDSFGIDCSAHDTLSTTTTTTTNSSISSATEEKNNKKKSRHTQRQYARRGSVTRYQMEAPTTKMQPSNICKSQRRRRSSSISSGTPTTTTCCCGPKRRSRSSASETSSAVVNTSKPLALGPETAIETPAVRSRRASRLQHHHQEQEHPISKYHRRGSVTKYSLGKNRQTEKAAAALQPSASSSSMKRRTVQFDTVRVVEFNTILGDNPSVRSGAPIMLGWDCVNQSQHSIDVYEKWYKDVENGGVGADAIPVQDRAMILLRAGYNIYQIGNATLEADLVKKQRLETLQSLSKVVGGERMTLFMESATKALKRMVPYSSSSTSAASSSPLVQDDFRPTFVGAKTA